MRVISQISGQKNLVFGRYGKEEGDFDGPHSVAVDGHDNIYVADLYNQRLQVFDRQGGFLCSKVANWEGVVARVFGGEQECGKKQHISRRYISKVACVQQSRDLVFGAC